MGLLDRLLGRVSPWENLPERFMSPGETYSFNGNSYWLPYSTSWETRKSEPIGNDFVAYVQRAYKGNGIAFAAIEARRLLFSEARFTFRDRRTGKQFGTDALAPLELPGENMTTGELLSRIEQDISLGGNWYGVRQGRYIKRLRPDWVTILIGSQRDPDEAAWMRDAVLVGYLYQPGGTGGDPDEAEILLPNEVAHFSPIPDPENAFRGMSWLTPIAAEIVADSSATTQKQAYFDNAMTPNAAIIMSDDVRTPEQFRQAREQIDEAHAGASKAFKTLYLAAGTTVQPIGSSLREMDFSAIQAGGEARIAVASRVPAAILGIKEGLAGSSLNAGNLGVARRLFADGWARPQWRAVCSALAKLVEVPTGAELWYDDSDIAFLREDASDAASIIATQAQAIRTLTDGGFEPASARDAVIGGDLGQLVHTGYLSVQMQPPGTTPNSGGGPARSSGTRGDNYDLHLTIEPPSVHVDAPSVTVEPAPSPTIHVNAPNVRMDAPVVNVEPPAVTVEAPTVNVEAPNVTVEAPNRGEPLMRTKHVVRDEDGLIVRVIEEEV
jgi:hypothetical protein